MDFFIQNKTKLFLAVSVIIVLIVGITIGNNLSSEERKIIDAFEDLELIFRGIDESGTASILTQEIEYTGKNEATEKLINGLTYVITPEKGLSNGDKVKVKIRYPSGLIELADIQFKQEEKEFTVSGLTSSDRQKIESSLTLKDQDGNDVEVTTEHFLIEGVEIPTYWNLTDEEIQEYVNYVKQTRESPSEIIDIEARDSEWIQGEGEVKTECKNADFLSKNYLDNSITTYKQAYQYGIESSQEFKIEPIMQDLEAIGYRCVFKEEQSS